MFTLFNINGFNKRKPDQALGAVVGFCC